MKTFVLWTLLIIMSQGLCIHIVFARQSPQEESVIDLLKNPSVINEFSLDLYSIKDSRVLEMLDEGTKILNNDSINGDFVELTVSNCNHGTSVKVEKKYWSSQTDDLSSLLGYCRYKGQIVVIKCKSPLSRFFKKSKSPKPISIKQFETTDMVDYNPPIFLLPRSKYLRITYFGLLYPVISSE